jgi:hypothetical protein
MSRYAWTSAIAAEYVAASPDSAEFARVELSDMWLELHPPTSTATTATIAAAPRFHNSARIGATVRPPMPSQ